MGWLWRMAVHEIPVPIFLFEFSDFVMPNGLAFFTVMGHELHGAGTVPGPAGLGMHDLQGFPISFPRPRQALLMVEF